MNLSIIILYEPSGDLLREMTFKFINKRMGDMFPDAEIIVAGDPTDYPEYCRSHSINAGVARASKDNLVIMDADIYLYKHQITNALRQLDKEQFIIPFDMVKDLNKAATIKLIEGEEIEFETLIANSYMDRDITENKAAGGCQIIKKKFFNDIGGYDERFIGWGYEDTAFCFAVRKALQQPDANFLLHETVFHMFHDRRQNWYKNHDLCVDILKEMGFENTWIEYM